MTRAQLRTRLERRLQDSTEETWDEAAKNELLNDGLRKIQERIMHIDPYFLIYVDTADVVSGEPRVKKPAGFIYEFKLAPTPTAGVVNGLRLTWMPTLSMAADTDVPDIHINLHPAIVVAAQLIALGDTGVAREGVAAELEWHASPETIGRYYQRSAADLDYLRAEYGKVVY